MLCVFDTDCGGRGGNGGGELFIMDWVVLREGKGGGISPITPAPPHTELE